MRREYDHTHPEIPRQIHPECPGHLQKPELHKWWVGGWLAPIFVAGFTVLWCLLIFGLIGERPTKWQYGVVPYLPSESIISSRPAPSGTPPKQIEFPAKQGSTSHD